jgi:hypothetical protein
MTDVDEREARNPFSGPRADLGGRAQTTDTIIIGVAVIAGLYLGREVLVPSHERDRHVALRCEARRLRAATAAAAA